MVEEGWEEGVLCLPMPNMYVKVIFRTHVTPVHKQNYNINNKMFIDLLSYVGVIFVLKITFKTTQQIVKNDVLTTPNLTLTLPLTLTHPCSCQGALSHRLCSSCAEERLHCLLTKCFYVKQSNFVDMASIHII